MLSNCRHTLEVFGIAADRQNYSGSRKQISVTVRPCRPVINWTNKTLTYPNLLTVNILDAICFRERLETTPRGDGGTLPEDVQIDGTFIYNPPINTLLPSGEHILAVKFVPRDSENFASTTAAVTLTVQKGKPDLHWENDGQTVVYGLKLSDKHLLNATCVSEGVDGSFSYSHEVGQVLPVGTHTLRATFIPSDKNYLQSEIFLTVSVEKRHPNLRVPPSEHIRYGTLINEELLGARIEDEVDIKGHFEYHPILGEMLEVGDHGFEVTFVPSDLASFHKATAKITIIVSKFIPRIIW